MALDIQRFTSSTFGVSLALAIGQVFPARPGHYLVDLLAKKIASQRDTPLVRAVRANQWVVHDECISKEELDQAVTETFRHLARSLFDLYHYMNKPKAVSRLIVMDSFIEQNLKRPEFDQQGMMVVGLHISSFDLVLQWFSRQGIKPLALTLPLLEGGHRLEYLIRRKTGLNLLPGSVGALRQTLRHLQRGGFVVTGIDRPIPNPTLWPRFFGRPAALPTHHVYLASKAQIPIRLMFTFRHADGKYHIQTSEPIEMDHYPDREIETLRNAEKVLNIAERYIRQTPHQWSISLPVWPETLSLVPD